MNCIETWGARAYHSSGDLETNVLGIAPVLREVAASIEG